jgi:hypothetical protein
MRNCFLLMAGRPLCLPLSFARDDHPTVVTLDLDQACTCAGANRLGMQREVSHAASVRTRRACADNAGENWNGREGFSADQVG